MKYLNKSSSNESLISHQKEQPILENHIFRKGRRFHNIEGSNYPFPDDTIEINRLKLEHYISKYAWQENIFYSPLENELVNGGFRVLDVGCGCGSFLLDLAQEYKEATFIGVDIADMILKEKRPSNVGFIQCNVLEGLPFPDNTFDFVFQSNMIAAFTERQWPLIIDEIVRVTKPGGWIELEERYYDFESCGPTTLELQTETLEFSRSKGLNFAMAPEIYKFLESHDKLSKNICSGVTNMDLGGNTLGELAFKSFKEMHFAMKIPFLERFSDIECEEYFNIIHQECEINQTNIKMFKYFVQKNIE
ncbi:3540_t:CDS:2 [Diversispora eburnea]|uniref:3540_t:CDS:1 n=1 Tax=Diversispora eburnea TaxID=1213867 RepID=A0A9N9F7C9_9GLOM|nr:3540_t:CDS:2 [Diversispora eburnea]